MPENSWHFGDLSKGSRQQINTSMTTIFFSQVTLEDNGQFIKEALRVLENHQYEKYLSLPSLIGWKKKKQALTILRRECGKNYKARKRSFCLKWLERSLLKLWFRQYHSILWVISSYPWVYALISSVLFESFGGGDKVIDKKFIGWNEKIFVSLILRVVWGLRIRLCLTITF